LNCPLRHSGTRTLRPSIQTIATRRQCLLCKQSSASSSLLMLSRVNIQYRYNVCTYDSDVYICTYPIAVLIIWKTILPRKYFHPVSNSMLQFESSRTYYDDHTAILGFTFYLVERGVKFSELVFLFLSKTFQLRRNQNTKNVCCQQGCQICFGPNIPKRKIYQMTTN
jgi:hypothetical protein